MEFITNQESEEMAQQLTSLTLDLTSSLES